MDPDQESDEDASDYSDHEFMDMEIMTNFEGRAPEDSDAPGIKLLLQQLFQKTNVNVADLTDLILSQNYVGCVFKQICDDEDDDDDDDAMDDDSDDLVLGLTTAINLTDKKGRECIKQLITLVTSRCQKVVPAVAGKVTEMLHSEDEPVGFLVNERYLNIVPKIATSSFPALKQDLERACRKKMNFAFKHFLMLCKTYRCKQVSGAGDSTLYYKNAEEELIAEVADIQATWSVADQQEGSDAGGPQDEEDMERTCTMMLFSADKLDAIISRFQAVLAT